MPQTWRRSRARPYGYEITRAGRACSRGVALVELLQRAGVPLGKDLRGDRMVTYVVVGAADGYRVVFALPEIDPAFSDRLILLADRRDQQPLSAEEGPLRLIVPGEKRQARWVRQVTAVTIRRAE
jgi:Oxidoreductase molybdopterin binding domain